MCCPCTAVVPAGSLTEYKYVLVDSAGSPLAWQDGNNSVLALRAGDTRVEVFDSWCVRLATLRGATCAGCLHCGEWPDAASQCWGRQSQSGRLHGVLRGEACPCLGLLSPSLPGRACCPPCPCLPCRRARPSAPVLVNGDRPETRESRLLAWADDLHSQLAKQKGDLRRTRMQLTLMERVSGAGRGWAGGRVDRVAGCSFVVWCNAGGNCLLGGWVGG